MRGLSSLVAHNMVVFKSSVNIELSECMGENSYQKSVLTDVLTMLEIVLSY